MNKTMISLIILLAIGALIGATGQIFLKNGIREFGEINVKLPSIFTTIFKILTNKSIILGLFISAIAAFFWMVAISRIDLSIGSPIGGGLFYVFVIILSVLFLKEKINYAQLVGIIIILAGIFVLSKAGR